MNCTFFGHRDAPERIKEKLKGTILSLLENGVECFYVGNNGKFDFLVQTALAELSLEHQIKYRIVLSRIDECALSGAQDKTIFCEGMEQAMPRFAISKRNEWLIKNSAVVVAYVVDIASNSSAWIEKARKRGLTVINLAK